MVDKYVVHYDEIHLREVVVFFTWAIYSDVAIFLSRNTNHCPSLSRLAFRLRDELFSRLLKLPMTYFDKNKSGDTMSRFTNDVDNVNMTPIWKYYCFF